MREFRKAHARIYFPRNAYPFRILLLLIGFIFLKHFLQCLNPFKRICPGISKKMDICIKEEPFEERGEGVGRPLVVGAETQAEASLDVHSLAERLVSQCRSRSDVEYLTESCRGIMESRMMGGQLVDAVPTSVELDVALDVVGPAVEQVVARLTREYEEELMRREAEKNQLVGALDEMRTLSVKLNRRVDELEQERERDRAGLAVEQCAMTTELKDSYESTIGDLRRELEVREGEIASIQLDMSKRCNQLESELENAKDELMQLSLVRSKYKSMIKENRELHEMIQDLRGNIRVYTRVRPQGVTGDASPSVIEYDEDEGTMAVYSNKHRKWMQFKFDRVFGQEATQEAIYMEAKPLINSVLDGYSVCIFAYGQTGSGKTHTMSGQKDDPGINVRAIRDLFHLQEERSEEEEFTFKVQLLEIYNESIRDLLSEDTDKILKLVATKTSGSNVPDATQVDVSNADDVAHLLDLGDLNRSVGATNMNERSSRSHQILTVMVDGYNRTTQSRSRGCLNLIDLAGSERVSRSGAQGVRLTEAQHINKSLSALGTVMQALAEKREHIPFRDSKLTSLLSDSLSGNAKSMMFVHCSPEETSVSETLSTLNFGKGVTEITLGQAKRHVEPSSSAHLRARLETAEKELAALKSSRVLQNNNTDYISKPSSLGNTRRMQRLS
ncbi:hypothetical protein M9434_001933 [Picochlorum sp. BPE23]|nr:hypothetical protein M9434_001933 [Picochlorum sp. BPE23]